MEVIRNIKCNKCKTYQPEEKFLKNCKKMKTCYICRVGVRISKFTRLYKQGKHPIFCKHGRECDGDGICEHKEIRHNCRECHSDVICEHDEIRHYCRECHSDSICELHGRIRYYCKECSNISISETEAMRHYCKLCFGESIAEKLRIRDGRLKRPLT